MTERVRMWVWPEFKKKVAKKKIDGDFNSMEEYTKELANKLDDFELKKCKRKRGGRGFDFRI